MSTVRLSNRHPETIRNRSTSIESKHVSHLQCSIIFSLHTQGDAALRTALPWADMCSPFGALTGKLFWLLRMPPIPRRCTTGARLPADLRRKARERL
jgi:hypothetical protein